MDEVDKSWVNERALKAMLYQDCQKELAESPELAVLVHAVHVAQRGQKQAALQGLANFVMSFVDKKINLL
jgi:hypothetical protein